METKICTKCKVVKEYDAFHKNINTKSGRSTHCKECTSNYFKQYKKLKPKPKQSKQEIAAIIKANEAWIAKQDFEMQIFIAEEESKYFHSSNLF